MNIDPYIYNHVTANVEFTNKQHEVLLAMDDSKKIYTYCQACLAYELVYNLKDAVDKMCELLFEIETEYGVVTWNTMVLCDTVLSCLDYVRKSLVPDEDNPWRW